MGSSFTAISSEEYERLKSRLLAHMRAERLWRQPHRTEDAFAVYLDSEAIALSHQDHRQMFSELMELLRGDMAEVV